VPRKFNGVVVFNAYFIRPIEDPHEVFFHLMEAMVVTLGHARGQPPVCALRPFFFFFNRHTFLNAIRVCHSEKTMNQSLWG